MVGEWAKVRWRLSNEMEVESKERHVKLSAIKAMI
jgi:hypothetical protein